MRQADEAARDLGLSRSALFAQALRDFLKQQRRAIVTKRLNEAYPEEPKPAERALVRKLKTKLPISDRW